MKWAAHPPRRQELPQAAQRPWWVQNRFKVEQAVVLPKRRSNVRGQLAPRRLQPLLLNLSRRSQWLYQPTAHPINKGLSLRKHRLKLRLELFQYLQRRD